MILVDTGPLIVLIDRGQGESHIRCVEAYQQFTGSLMTTWSCFTEAMYFLAELQGWNAQRILWQFVDRQALLLHDADWQECQRMRELMEKYQNVPMDLADASLVAAAETLKLKRIFTLDSDFYIYRYQDKAFFEVIPST